MKKQGQLTARWSKASKYAPGLLAAEGVPGDIVYAWGDGVAKADQHLLHNALANGKWDPTGRVFNPSFIAELHARGYDLTTLKFSISKLAEGK